MVLSRPSHEGDQQAVVVVGADPIAAVTARRLPGKVQFLGLSEGLVRRVADDVDTAAVLRDPQRLTGVDDAVDTAVVATPDDGLNLLYTQCLRVEHGVSDVVVRLNDPDNRDALANLPVESICTATSVAETLGETYARVVA